MESQIESEIADIMDVADQIYSTFGVTYRAELSTRPEDFMGEIETRFCDLPDWTPEKIRAEVERACRKCKGPSFIPCLTAGMPMSSNPGVYEAVSAEIDRMSKELF